MRTRHELARLAAALGGLPILGCFKGSPAAEAGVRYGDVLLAIDGTPTSTWDEYVEAREAIAGREFVARIFRNGEELDVRVVLLDRPRPSEAEMLDELGELRITAIDPGAKPAGPSN